MTDETRQSPTETASHDICSNCAYCAGPMFTMCVSETSEFGGGPVHPLGWCDEFKQLTRSHLPEGK
jgi:hypothetical protein